MFYVRIPFLHLDDIYNSNQCVRWIKITDGKYLIQSGNDVVKVTENTNSRFLFDCSEEEFFSKWFNYFDLKRDYSRMNWVLKNLDDEVKIAANRNKGLRIIKVPLLESIIYSCIKSLFSVDRSRMAVDSIAKSCGVKHIQSFKESGKLTWHEFPSPETILEKELFLDSKMLMHQKESVISICKDIVSGWLDLDYLQMLGYIDAFNYLIQFDYLNEWAVNFICLSSLGFINLFPMDKHISKFFKKIEIPYIDFKDWYMDDEARSYSGLLSHYIWSNEVNPPKRLEEWMKE